MKPTFFKILLYIFIKYIVFYTFLMLNNNNTKLLEWNNLTSGATFTYFFLVMFIPILISMVCFSIPLYYSFKINNKVYLSIIIGLIFILEYFVYVYLTSQKYFYDWNGIFNFIISVLLLLVLFTLSKANKKG